jgi:hypothetical protein
MLTQYIFNAPGTRVSEKEAVMKRLAYAALIPLLAAGLYCRKDKAEGIERIGIVNFMAGTVLLIDGSKKAPARVGDVVSGGMTIETGPASFVDIYFDDNAIKVLEKSSVTVKELLTDTRENAEKTGLHVTRGRIYVRVARKLAKSERFAVTSPTTTAGVRGTEFLVAQEGEKGTVACLTGTVEVKNEASPAGDTVDVTDKKEVVVEKDKPMEVKDLSAENRNLMEDIRKSFKDKSEEIRRRFEKKREEIRKAVDDMRSRNLEAVDRQKAKDLENIDKLKSKNEENMNKLKQTADKMGSGTQEVMDRQKENAQKNLDKMKPDMDKFQSPVK